MPTCLTFSDLQAFLTTHAINGEIVHMDVPTSTVAAAAQALGVTAGQIVKSILFLVEVERRTLPAPGQGDERGLLPVLCITSGTAYVDRRLVGAYFGVGRKRVRLAAPEEVISISGYAVGAMPPFGHRQPLITLLDRGVLELPAIYAGGGAENAMLRLDPREIVRTAHTEVLDLVSP